MYDQRRKCKDDRDHTKQDKSQINDTNPEKVYFFVRCQPKRESLLKAVLLKWLV